MASPHPGTLPQGEREKIMLSSSAIQDKNQHFLAIMLRMTFWEE